jgi:DNA primase
MILKSKVLALLNEALGQNAKLRKGGLEASYFCCFCNHYKRKLEVNLFTGHWSCWVCHARGSYLGSLLTKIKAPRQFRERLFELTKDIRFVRKSRSKEKPGELTLPSDFISLASPPVMNELFPEHMQEYRRAIDYLKSREIGIDDICRYNIGYCETGEYRDCVVVPSYDWDGKLNYFSSRHYYPHKWLKYQNAPFSKNIVGFECFINYDEPVTLVEGVFDAISVRNNAVPLFGTTLSWRLKEALVINRTKRINIVLDNDAMENALNIVEDLKQYGDAVGGFDIHLVKLPEKDPSEIGFYVMTDLIERSKSFKYDDLVYEKVNQI